MLGGYFQKILIAVALVNILNAIILSAITGFWFVYVELSQGELYIKRFKIRLFVLSPVVISTLIMVILFVFFPKAVLKEDNTLTLTYYILFLSVPVLYIILSTVRCFIRAFKKENYAVRGPYLSTAIYPVILAACGVVQTLWITVPMFCFGCAIMMIYVYITSLNDQVSIDELTRLNNRTQLKKFIVGESAKPGNEKHYVLMIDLNRFKQINDQYGHVEGDHALKRAADALKLACSDNDLRPFIARYGGDEFIIIARTENEELIKELCTVIKETLIRLNTEAKAAYELTASIGYASYTGDIHAFQTALTKADEALYADKKARAGS